MTRHLHLVSAVVATAALFCGTTLRADVFVYLDQAGNEKTLEARLAGTGQGAMALERADGQIILVAESLIRDRAAAAGPEPIDADAMVHLLEERFGTDHVRTSIDKPFVIALVLSAPLDRRAERQVTGFVTKASRFMSNVDAVFTRFIRDMRIPMRKPEYPLVLLIFESDTDFNRYATEVTGGNGLSASRMAGFYSSLTNWLAVRMSACDTFEVPLHEAIHQQMYNRVFQRLAAIPVWFDEGIATGFESDGERIDVHPARVNSRYARQAKQLDGPVTWESVITDDSAFRGDILAGDAYTHAWSLHWMLVKRYRDQYRDYVTSLASREPLQEQSEAERLRSFEAAFGTTVPELFAEFPRVLDSEIRRQRVSLREPARAGELVTQDQLGEVRMQAVRRADLAGQLLVQGELRNASPFRTLCYHVTVETDAGLYAEWFVPDLGSGRKSPLKRQIVRKRMQNAPGGLSQTFRVRIRSALSESEDAAAWKRGELPVPVYGR
ncbi:MAG: DUF1570 domain-containing protein [Maioricimonas sp. JB049]